jgi:hypothetical protein
MLHPMQYAVTVAPTGFVANTTTPKYKESNIVANTT